MHFVEQDFLIEKGMTQASTDFRRRMDSLCREIRNLSKDDPVLTDLIRDHYVGSNSDPLNQWFCILPGDKEFKTSFIHFHGVFPQSGMHGTVPWFGLDAEFKGPRETIESRLRTLSGRNSFLEKARGATEAMLWVVNKFVVKNDHQRYEWGAVDKAFNRPVSSIDTAFLESFRDRLGAGSQLMKERPGWEIWPAVVIGWRIEPHELIAWGDEAPVKIYDMLVRVAPLWNYLARD